MIFATLFGAGEAIGNAKKADKQATAALKSAVGKIVKAGVKAAKRSLTRKRSGALAKSIGSTVKVYQGRVVGLVGTQKGFRTTLVLAEEKKRGTVFYGVRGTKKQLRAGKGKVIKLKGGGGLKEGDVLDPARYGHFIEKGHIKGRGKSSAKAYPFLKPAFQETTQTGGEQLKQELLATVGKP